MNYKLLRAILVLGGLAGVAAFGLAFADFLRHRGERLAPFALDAWMQQNVRPPLSGDEGGHLRPWETYALLHKLDLTENLPKVAGAGDAPPPPPPPVVGENDLSLAYIQYVEGASERSAAYIYPKGQQVQDGKLTGGLYQVGQRFTLPAKAWVQIEVAAIRPREVDLTVHRAAAQAEGGGEEPLALTLRLKTFELTTSLIRAVSGSDEAGLVRRPAPKRTRLVGQDEWEVGTDDVAEVEAMPEDQIYAAVQVKPEHDRATGRIRGLRLARIQEGSVFERFGAEKDDILLSVNGYPATDRADLLRWMRAQEGVTTFTVRFERKGYELTHTYRLPQR